MLLWFVDVVEIPNINAHLVKRPELILSDIRVLIMASVLYMDVKTLLCGQDKNSL